MSWKAINQQTQAAGALENLANYVDAAETEEYEDGVDDFNAEEAADDNADESTDDNSDPDEAADSYAGAKKTRATRAATSRTRKSSKRGHTVKCTTCVPKTSPLLKDDRGRPMIMCLRHRIRQNMYSRWNKWKKRDQATRESPTILRNGTKVNALAMLQRWKATWAHKQSNGLTAEREQEILTMIDSHLPGWVEKLFNNRPKSPELGVAETETDEDSTMSEASDQDQADATNEANDTHEPSPESNIAGPAVVPEESVHDDVVSERLAEFLSNTPAHGSNASTNGSSTPGPSSASDRQQRYNNMIANIGAFERFVTALRDNASNKNAEAFFKILPPDFRRVLSATNYADMADDLGRALNSVARNA